MNKHGLNDIKKGNRKYLRFFDEDGKGSIAITSESLKLFT